MNRDLFRKGREAMRRVLVLLAGIGLLGVAVGCKSDGHFMTGVCDCVTEDHGCAYYDNAGCGCAAGGAPALAPAPNGTPVPNGATKPEGIKEMPKPIAPGGPEKVPAPKQPE
jgi:hypothetical protein